MDRVIFYNDRLKPIDHIDLFESAWELGTAKWIDELDTEKSPLRKRVDMPLDEFIDKAETADYTMTRYTSETDPFTGMRVFEVFMTFTEWKYKKDTADRWHRMAHRDLFGWVRMPAEDAAEIVLKYGLMAND